MKFMKKLVELEARYMKLTAHPTIPGTQITRINQDGKWAWGLALGPMSMPKSFWTGRTMTEVLRLAESDIAEAEGKKAR